MQYTDRPEVHPADDPAHGKPGMRHNAGVQRMGRQADGDPDKRSEEGNTVQSEDGAGYRPARKGRLKMIERGYPLTDGQAEWEADAAEQWERQNTPHSHEVQMVNAAKRMRIGAMKVGNCIDDLVGAIKILGDTQEADKVSSLVNDLENLWSDLNALQRKYAKGVIS